MKKKKIKFVTMFPRIENIHLIKDVGMVPYCMKKYYDFDSSIVIYKNLEYPYFNSDVKTLSKDYFPLKKFNSVFNCCLYLLKKSKKIDVLHLYHMGLKTTMFSMLTYLLINKKGLIYVHMDMESGWFNGENDLLCLNGNSPKKILKRFIYKKVMFTPKNKNRILYGVQSNSLVDRLKQQFPFQKVEYITNGYENTASSKNVKKEKENIILFVGRVGSKEKRTDILLNGFKKAANELNDWKLRVVGPIEEDFKEVINLYKKNNPELIKRIEFTGPIYDRRKLNEEYTRAKVFCLTSDYESFGLVTVEALSSGCAIVSSNIDASKEIINIDEYGRLFKCGDSTDFSKKLIEVCNNEKLLHYVQKKGAQYIDLKYSYKNTLKNLNEWIIKTIK